jgi:hypothetical protein
VENLKRGWTPLWVKPHPDPASGNAELTRRGGCELPAESGDLAALFVRKAAPAVDHSIALIAEPAPPAFEPRETSILATDAMLDDLDFYQLFLHRLRTLTAKTPATDQELLARLDIGKPQLHDWLKRALEEGRITKLVKPVRYRWQTARPEQNSFFVNESPGEG